MDGSDAQLHESFNWRSANKKYVWVEFVRAALNNKWCLEIQKTDQISNSSTVRRLLHTLEAGLSNPIGQC